MAKTEVILIVIRQKKNKCLNMWLMVCFNIRAEILPVEPVMNAMRFLPFCVHTILLTDTIKPQPKPWAKKPTIMKEIK